MASTNIHREPEAIGLTQTQGKPEAAPIVRCDRHPRRGCSGGFLYGMREEGIGKLKNTI